MAAQRAAPEYSVPSAAFVVVSISVAIWLYLVVLVLSMFAGGVARADITGDTVVIHFLYPNSGTQFGLSRTGVVTATGVSLNLFGTNR